MQSFSSHSGVECLPNVGFAAGARWPSWSASRLLSPRWASIQLWPAATHEEETEEATNTSVRAQPEAVLGSATPRGERGRAERERERERKKAWERTADARGSGAPIMLPPPSFPLLTSSVPASQASQAIACPSCRGRVRVEDITYVNIESKAEEKEVEQAETVAEHGATDQGRLCSAPAPPPPPPPPTPPPGG